MPAGSCSQLSRIKNINQDLSETRRMMVSELHLLQSVGHNVQGQSDKIQRTGGVYKSQQHSLDKSQKYIQELHRKNRANKIKIYGSFLFLLLVAANVFLRRVLRVRLFY